MPFEGNRDIVVLFAAFIEILLHSVQSSLQHTVNQI